MMQNPAEPHSQDLTPLRWIRRIRQEWQIQDDEQLARLLHCPLASLRRWLETRPEQDLGATPTDCLGAAALIQVRKKLETVIPEPEEQVRWLFTKRKDFDGLPPIELMGHSPEELAWVAYYLDSITGQPQDESVSH
jgi:hypothetical protein